jgi:hypothetical protein
MRFWPKRKRDTRRRLTGASISATGVGFNWQHDKSDRQRAQESLHRLEAHRMLYDPYEAEHIQPVIGSAERLRDFLIEQIPQCHSDVLRDHLRVMQTAVRRCLTRIHGARSRINELWPAVSELRSRVGTTAEAIAETFDIPVNGDLAMIIANGESAVAARAAAFVRGVPWTPDGGPFPTCPSCGVNDSHIRWTADNLFSGRSWWCSMCDTEWTTPWPSASSPT